MTLHGAPGNHTSDRRRRGLATRWCGDDARFDPRPKTMTLPFDPELNPGDPLKSPNFPLHEGWSGAGTLCGVDAPPSANNSEPAAAEIFGVRERGA